MLPLAPIPTMPDENGKPMVFVLTRDGLRWKLSDVRLPL